MEIKRVANIVLGKVSLRSLIIMAFFVGCSVAVGSWWLAVLLFPLYWQTYLKKDLAPEWW